MSPSDTESGKGGVVTTLISSKKDVDILKHLVGVESVVALNLQSMKS